MQAKLELILGRIFVFFTIATLWALSILGCDSVSPTKPANVNNSQGTEEKLGKATSP